VSYLVESHDTFIGRPNNCLEYFLLCKKKSGVSRSRSSFIQALVVLWTWCVVFYCNRNPAVLYSLHRRRVGGSLSGGPVFPFAKAASI